MVPAGSRPRERIDQVAFHLAGAVRTGRTLCATPAALPRCRARIVSLGAERPARNDDGLTKMEEIQDPDAKPFGEVPWKLPRVKGRL